MKTSEYNLIYDQGGIAGLKAMLPFVSGSEKEELEAEISRLEMINKKRDRQEYSKDQIDLVDRMVDEYNSDKMHLINEWCYIMELTGKHQVYFTLWRYKKPLSGYVDPFTYIKNLSTNIVEAVEKIINQASKLGIPVLIYEADNNLPLFTKFKKRSKEGVPHIPFGKYKGLTMGEVWDRDQNYVLWFANNYKKGDYNGRPQKRSEEDNILIRSAEELKSIFWEQKTEENRLSSKSEYVGNIKERKDFKLTITKVIKKSSYDDQYVMNLANDPDGNQFMFYGDFQLDENKQYEVTGTIVDHKENLGIKTTRINRVKITLN